MGNDAGGNITNGRTKARVTPLVLTRAQRLRATLRTGINRHKKTGPEPCFNCYPVMDSQTIVGVMHELDGVQSVSSHVSHPSNTLASMNAIRDPVSARAMMAPAVSPSRFILRLQVRPSLLRSCQAHRSWPLQLSDMP